MDDTFRCVVSLLKASDALRLRATSQSFSIKTLPLITKLDLRDDAADHLNLDTYVPRDISVLSRCTGLVSLYLQGRSLENLEPIRALSSLTFLRVQFSRFRDLTPLVSCAALTELQLKWLPLMVDISPLASCAALTSLNIDFCNEVEDFSPIASCAALSSLNLHRCGKLTDLRFLASCTALTSLNFIETRCLMHNEVDYSPIASCTALTSLSLIATNIMDLGPLASCTELMRLDLSYSFDIGDDLDAVSRWLFARLPRLAEVELFARWSHMDETYAGLARDAKHTL